MVVLVAKPEKGNMMWTWVARICLYFNIYKTITGHRKGSFVILIVSITDYFVENKEFFADDLYVGWNFLFFCKGGPVFNMPIKGLLLVIFQCEHFAPSARDTIVSKLRHHLLKHEITITY